MKHTTKRILILLILAAIVFAVGTAAAEHAKTLEPRIIPLPEDPAPRRGGARISGIGTDQSDGATTCVSYTYTVNNGTDTGVVWYEYKMAILDDPRSGKPADTMYASDWTKSNQFTYTFYRTGTYVLFVYRYDKNGVNVKNDDYPEPNNKNVQHRIYITADCEGNPLNAAVATAAAACDRDNDFDTAVAINDYLADKVTYDYSYTHYSPEAALLWGRGVCNSYSRAYELIATACGLNCKRVNGSVSGEGHAWNVVEINDKWYQIDATWNDSGSNASRHIYMGLSDEVIGNDHFNFEYPYIDGGVTCDSLEDNYYVRTGKWRKAASAGETYSTGSVMAKVQEALDGLNGESGTITATFGTSTGLEDGNLYLMTSAKRKILGQITAYALSRETLIRTAGGVQTPMKGVFTYTHYSNGGALSGEMAESGLTISGLQASYDTGESISATAAFDMADYAGNPEGLTQEAHLFYKEDEDNRQGSSTVTYIAGEGLELNTAGWRLWDNGDAVIEAVVRDGDGLVVSRARKTFTVTASQGEMNLSEPMIPSYFVPGECVLQPFTDADEAAHGDGWMRATVTAHDDTGSVVRYDEDGLDLNAGISFTANAGESISIYLAVTEAGYTTYYYKAENIPVLAGMSDAEHPITISINPAGGTLAICQEADVTVNAEGAEWIRLEDSNGHRWEPESGAAATFEIRTGEETGRYSVRAVVGYGDGTECVSEPLTVELTKTGEIRKVKMEAEFNDPKGRPIIERGGDIEVTFTPASSYYGTGVAEGTEVRYELCIDSMDGTSADPTWEWTDEVNHILVIRTGRMPAGAYRMSGIISAPGYVPYYTSNDGEIQFVVKAVPEADPEKLTKLILPDNLDRIEANAFERIAAEAVIIPQSCTYIGSHAFLHCPNLVYVEYYAGTTVEEDAFAECNNPEIRVIGE